VKDPADPYYPELLDFEYFPKNPTSETGVNLTITYKDLDGDPPESVYVHFDDGPDDFDEYYSMNVSSGNYSQGVTCYIIGLKLAVGNYKFKFHAINYLNETVSYPESPGGRFVFKIAPPDPIDHPPVLYNHSIYPSDPQNGDHVHFYVNYRDADNDAPGGVYLQIHDYNRSFSKNLAMYSYQNYSYSHGLQYTVNISLPNGTYNYRYLAYNTVNVTLPRSNTFYFEVGDGGGPVQTPSLYSPGVSPQNPVENQTINFTINYKDPYGGNVPHYVKLAIAREGGTISRYNLATTGSSYRTGVLFYQTLALSEGNHTYFFELVVGNFSARLPTDHNYTLYVGPGSTKDNAPVLKNGLHSPSSPKDGDNITFSVTYKDADGDAPTHIMIYIGPRSVNGSVVAQYLHQHNLTWTGTSYRSGITASVTLSLKQGHYRYCFVTSNSKHTFIVWHPGNSSYLNLDVSGGSTTPSNSPPVLYSPSVNPSRPVPDQNVNFSISYRDIDGDAPSSLKLMIGPVSGNSTAYNMNIAGNAYASGITGFKVIKLSAGNYSYHFQTISGNHTVSYPHSGTYLLHVGKSEGEKPKINRSSSVSIMSDGSGGADITEIEVEDGLTLQIEDYEDGKISFLIESEEEKDRVITIEIEKDLLGEMTEKGIVIKVDGDKIGSSSLDTLKNSTGDIPLYNLEEKDGKYLLHLFLPDTSSTSVDATMGKDEESSDNNGLIVAALMVILLLAIISVAGIWGYTTTLQKKKKEAFFRDFNLDLEDHGDKTVVSGSLDDDEMDWDQMIE
jgi:hypothetical protein